MNNNIEHDQTDLVPTPRHEYRVKSISGFNFAGYENVMVNYDKNVNLLIGPNGQGKTTLGLNLIWFIMQGIAEKSSDGKIPLLGERFRFIGDNGATALGELVLYDEIKRHEIRVIRKLTKTGTELSFSAPAGMELDQQWLNSLFNIFLIAPKRFIALSSKEQSLVLGIVTEKWDSKISELKEKFTEINRELKVLDKLEEVEMVERIPIDVLQQRKAEIKKAMHEQYLLNQNLNKTARINWENEKSEIDRIVAEFNQMQTQIQAQYNECEAAAKVLVDAGFSENNTELVDLLQKLRNEIKPEKVATDLYRPEPEYIPELPDDAEMIGVDAKILAATETNGKALLYEQYQAKLKLKGEKENELQQNKDDQARLYEERLDYIKAFKFPFSTLSVDDEGGLLLRDKPLRDPYFSTGELIRIIPTLMASQNPELKYVFIQEANLLDEDNLAKIEKDLTEKGFQLVFEIVGKEKVVDKNCILLKNCGVVGEYANSKTVIELPAKEIDQ